MENKFGPFWKIHPQLLFLSFWKFKKYVNINTVIILIFMNQTGYSDNMFQSSS